jgi:hypothetical protein
MPAQARATYGRRIDKVASGEGQPDVDGVARLTIHGSRDFVCRLFGKGRRAQSRRRYEMRSDGCHKDGAKQQSACVYVCKLKQSSQYGQYSAQ